LLFCLALLAGSLLQLLYRYTLPTDGWVVVTTEIGDPSWIYWQNLVGAPTEVQRGDLLLAVEGIDVTGQSSTDSIPPPPGWQSGQTVQVVVQREEQQIAVALPVVSWTPAAVLAAMTADVDTIISLFGGLVLAGIGFFTFFRRPELPSARLLLVFSSGVSATVISGILPDGLSMQFDALAFQLTGFFSYAIFGTLIMPTLLAFTIHFPRPKKWVARYPALGLSPFLIGLALFIGLNFLGLPAEIAWLASMGMLLATLGSLLHSGYTQRDSVSRAQFRWAFSGLVVSILLLLNVFPAALGWITNEFYLVFLSGTSGLAFTVLGLSFSIAILRYRLFDIDLVIRRTIQYSLVTVILGLVYGGSVVLLQQLFDALVGRPDSPLVIVISTLAIAALFNPLRHRLQNFIDRSFYRRAYDPEATLDRFAHQVSNELQVEQLCQQILGTVQATLEPSQASLWLQGFTEER
jgi:hypothetical protein